MVLLSTLPESCSSSWVAKPVQDVLTGVLTITEIFHWVRYLALKDGSVYAVGSALWFVGSSKHRKGYMTEGKDGL